MLKDFCHSFAKVLFCAFFILAHLPERFCAKGQNQLFFLGGGTLFGFQEISFGHP